LPYLLYEDVELLIIEALVLKFNHKIFVFVNTSE